MKEAEHSHISVTLSRNNQEFGRALDGCFLVRWLSLYTFVPLFKSLLRPLASTQILNSESDLVNLADDIHPAYNHHRYETVKEGAQPQDRHNVLRLLFRRLLLWEFILSGLLAIVVAALAFSGPLVIEKILKFLNEPGATVEQQKQAYMYAGIWIGLYLVRIFVNAYCQRRITFTALKAEQILVVELLEKMTRLAPSYRLDNERSRGQLLTILTEDVALVTEFLTNSSILFSAPATLIGVQIFLFLEVGAYGLALLLVLVVAGVVQMLLRKRILAVKAEKHALMGLRTLTNFEMFHSIESIKLMGWQPLITKKNLQYRQRENRMNQRHYRYLNIFDLVINLVPVLTVFLIFVLLLFTNESIDLNTTLVYTILSFVALTDGPVKSLLGAITSTVQGVRVLKSISKFLSEREIPVVRIQDHMMEAGTLIINNLVATWQPHLKEGNALSVSEGSKRKLQMSVSGSEHNLTAPLFSDMKKEELEQGLWQDGKDVDYEFIRRCGKFALRVPMKIELKKGERLVLVSKPQSGKSTFFQTLIGNLYVLSGSIQFGGRIGYLPQRLWFRKVSIRENVLFGLPYDKRKLDFVYRMVLLKNEICNFERGDGTIMDESNGLTEGQKRRVALARVLYYEPDLMLLDEVFAGLDPETTQQVYQNICVNYSNTSVILSTHVTNFVRKSDKLLILKQGTVVSCGTLHELEASLSQKLPQSESASVQIYGEQRLISRQIMLKEHRMRELKRKLWVFIKNIVTLTKGMTLQQVRERIFKEAERKKQIKLKETQITDRVKPLERKNYLRFIKLAPIGLHLLLLLLSILAQSVQVFADWWIGSVGTLPWPLNESQALHIYIGLTAAFGLFLALGGLISVVISAKSARKLTEKLCDSIAYASFDWHIKTNYIKVSQLANRDDTEIFGITSAAYSVFRDTLTFLATVVLVGISSPIFLALAAGAVLLDLLVFYVYGRAAAEMDVFDDQYHDPLIKTYEELINGIDLLRAFGKLTNPKNSIIEQHYNYSIYTINRKFLDMSMSLLTEIISLGIIAGAAYFAVRSKFNSEGIQQDMAIIGTSIAISMKLTGLAAGVSWGIADIKIGITDNIEKAYTIIDKEREEGYSYPIPLGEWPKNSSVEFQKVTLVYPHALKTAVNMLDLRIDPRERIFMTGKSASGKGAILKAIVRQLQPVRNIDLSMGRVKVGGVDLCEIGRKYVTKHISLLGSVPFMFTGTLRENMDPFGMYSDDEIKNSLDVVDVWSLLGTKKTELLEETTEVDIQGRLDQTVSNAGYYMSLGLLQQMNIARAVLSRPSVLLWDTAASSLDEITEGNVLDSITKALPKTTLIVISQKLTTATRLDKVIYMSNGRIKEYGRPRTLLRKKESNPFRRMVDASQAAHRVIKILNAVDQE